MTTKTGFFKLRWVYHDVGAAACAQLAGAVASAGAGVALVLHRPDDQTFSGFREKIEEEESSQDEDAHQGPKLPGQWNENESGDLN